MCQTSVTGKEIKCYLSVLAIALSVRNVAFSYRARLYILCTEMMIYPK